MDTETTLAPAGVETSAAAIVDVKKVLALALLTCAAARLCLVWRYYCISSDGVIYLRAAENFFAGNISAGFGSFQPPGYPVLIAAVFGIVRDWELAGQLLSVAFGVGLLVPLFLLLRDMFDERVAGVACLLASISPFLARYSAHVRSESPYLFFITLALWLLAQGMDQNRPGRFFGGGVVAGFAYLVRPEAVGMLVLIPGLLAFRRMALGQPDWGTVGKYTGLLTAGFLLFALPYIVYLSMETGEWGALSRKAGITLANSLEEAGIIDIDEAVARGDSESLGFFQLIRRHPLSYAAKVVTDLPHALVAYFEALHFSYVPFLLIGCFVAFRGQFWRRREFLLLSFVLFYFLGFAMILVRRRYSLQLVPVSLGWCAIGVLWVWQYCQTSLRPRASRIALASITAVFLAATLPKTLSAISPEKAYVREAGRYLGKLNQDRALKIAVFDERISYYAGAQTLSLFGVTETGLEKYLRDRKADFLAVESEQWQHHFPTAARQPEAVGLSLDKEFVGTRKDRLLVFMVN